MPAAGRSWKDPLPGVPVTQRGYAEGFRGVPIHYTVYGEGQPAIACCNGVGVSTFFWKYVVRYFAPRHRVIVWDYRGHNASGLPKRMVPSNFSMQANARDLHAVLDATGTERAVLLGHSMGCQVILEAWRRFPQRVAGLVPICGGYGKPLDTFFHVPAVSHRLFAGLHHLAINYTDELEAVLRPLLRSPLPFFLARLGAVNAQLLNFDDLKPYFEHLSEISLKVFFLMANEMQKHDAEGWLGKIRVPTLVVAGENDLFTPVTLALEMRDRIRGAELLLLPKGTHSGLIEHPELLNLRLEKFLRERVAATSKPPQRTTVIPMPPPRKEPAAL
ncbi:MAG TPA: alpha/beta hydrolase [Terriglobales bacterium]|nr:alpha/beta hydrolase [Terriglobales bacterium]